MIPTKYCCNIQSLQFLLYYNKIISHRFRRKVPERPPCLYGTHKLNNMKSTPHHLCFFSMNCSVFTLAFDIKVVNNVRVSILAWFLLASLFYTAFSFDSFLLLWILYYRIISTGVKTHQIVVKYLWAQILQQWILLIRI